MNKCSRLFKKRKEGLRVSFFDLPLVEELMEASAADASFSKSSEVFAGFNTIGKRRVPLTRFTGMGWSSRLC